METNNDKAQVDISRFTFVDVNKFLQTTAERVETKVEVDPPENDKPEGEFEETIILQVNRENDTDSATESICSNNEVENINDKELFKKYRNAKSKILQQSKEIRALRMQNRRLLNRVEELKKELKEKFDCIIMDEALEMWLNTE